MKKILLSSFFLLFVASTISAQTVKILYDATEGQTAGNADWVIDADSSNVEYTGTGGIAKRVTSNVQQDNAQRYPTPAQSGITSTTAETYWRGSSSAWAIDMVKKGYEVETLPTFDSITYGNSANPQDLSNYKVFIIDEPQFQFSSRVKTALMNFVQNGGGLFMISDHCNASRTNNGWDARMVWDDFIKNNPVRDTAFGFVFDSLDISPVSNHVNASATDSVIHGPQGNCPGMQWSSGTTETLYPADNATVTGDVFSTTASTTGVMFGHGRYGNGKFAFEGDSSPTDDGTGDRYGVANTSGLYTDFTGDPGDEEEIIIVNATIWLATNNSTSPTTLSATTSATTNVSCNGSSTGSASVSASGGTPAYTYSWAPSGGTAATATGLAAGTYTITVKDASGSSSTASVTITQPTAITATTTQTNVSCNGGSTGIGNVAATGGTAPFSYAWAPSGGTSSTATSLTSGSYTCTITDSHGCTVKETVAITQPAGALSATATQTNVICNGSNTGIANVSVSGGTAGYTYSWSPSGGSSATANGLAAGSYTCTITDSKGCTTTKSITITQPATALTATTTQTNVSCNGSNNGIANVSVTGGTAAYTYSWSPSGGTAASATGLASGTYICTITDSKGCTATKSVVISEPAVLTATTTQTNVSCNGSNTGIANVSATGGTAAYTYSWSPSGGTSASATNLASGTYTCTVTDSKGCTTTKSVTITQPAAALSATATQTNVICNGSNTGIANVSVSGGTAAYTYSWSPSGGTSASATGLASGTYICTITDSKGCTTVKTFNITEPTAITATATQTNVSCNGNNNGTALISATGGTAGYTYSWSPSGGTGASATSLASGTYICTITDSKGCTAAKSVVISEPAALVATTSTTNESGSGANNGTASVNPSGGTSPYSYSWSPTGQTTQTATGLTGGIYTCTITDSDGCSVVKTDTVNVSTGIATISNNSSSGISVYPNPANDDVNIVIGSVKENPVLYFYDVLGQQMEVLKLNNTQTVISKGTLPSGIYFYRLMNDTGMLGSGKLVILK